ncbi:MAG TPA: PucR family transcriptional regulator ligand-binding domain-containing protein [Pseudogracilibacillus sp.]|nr:PucR family transcriptional regulator ligand-binding domain-containing protein [Pseudogracilibacillus sp.]
MPVLLSEIYRSVSRQQHIELVAGKKGLSNEVKWIHVVENKEIASFLEGKEVVFTTGLAVQTEEKLSGLIKENIKNNVSGMVINIGPYISEVSNKIVAYCEKNDFPLFIVPWNVKIARIMKTFSSYIIDDEKKQLEITSAINNALFSSEQTRLYIPTLKRYGFQINSQYIIAVIKFYKNLDNLTITNIKKEVEFILKLLYNQTVVTQIDNVFVILFTGLSSSEIKHTVKKITLMIETKITGTAYLIAVGNATDNLTTIKSSYQKALKIIDMYGNKMTPINVIFYDDMGIYKVLLEIKDPNVVQSYILNTIQVLFDYDQLNGTSYTKTLRLYLEYNGAVSRLAEELFVHRNTINYRIDKIEKITNSDLSDFNKRLELALAFKLKSLFFD